MRFAETRISARLGWSDPFVRWTCIVSALFYLTFTIFFMWRLLPVGWRSGVIITHYNIYLGIDDVRSWMWILWMPAIALVVWMMDILAALAVYRQDPLAARTLTMAGAVGLGLWMIGSFFLLLVNL